MRLLLLLTLLPVLAQAQTTTWPHNPQTGEVGMQGLLPWPDSAKTQLQRRRLVQHWYVTKLAVLLKNKPQQPSNSIEPVYGIPLPVCLRRYQAATSQGPMISVTCQAELMPTPQGLAYLFTDFNFNWWEYDAGGSAPVDMPLPAEPASLKAREIIAIARKRLAALSSW
jgi:hypothetical protein